VVTAGARERVSHRAVVGNVRATVDLVAERRREDNAGKHGQPRTRRSCQRSCLATGERGITSGFVAELDDEGAVGGDVPWSTPYLCVRHPEALLDLSPVVAGL